MARGWGGSTAVTTRLKAGGRLEFAGRAFDVLHRPGHSPSDTVFFDAADGTLVAGDHLIKHISSNPLISRPLDGTGDGERPRALLTYMASMRETREMDIETVLPGHGDEFGDHAELIDERFAHARTPRAQDPRPAADRPLTAHEIAQSLWGTVAVTQAFLTLSEVLGHVDLLLERGEVVERETGGVIRFQAVWVHGVELVLISLLVSVVGAGGGRARGRRPVPDRARARRARDGLRARDPRGRARAGARARDLPAAAAVLGGVLREPARPPLRHPLDLAAGDRARDRHGVRGRGRRARADRRAARGPRRSRSGAIVAPTDPLAAIEIGAAPGPPAAHRARSSRARA